MLAFNGGNHGNQAGTESQTLRKRGFPGLVPDLEIIVFESTTGNSFLKTATALVLEHEPFNGFLKPKKKKFICSQSKFKYFNLSAVLS